MRDEFLEIVALQKEYSPNNTSAMQRRGELIRKLVPNQLANISPTLKLALGHHGDDLGFQGRDGTGLKTLIPWVRFYSRARSPTPGNGWYCVYLFDAGGDGVYLELGHGSTTGGTNMKVRSPEELEKLVAWGRDTLKDVIHSAPELSKPMTLHGKNLGDAYERSAVLAKWYPKDAIPSDEQLCDDAAKFAGYLKVIYDAETRPAPEPQSPVLLASNVLDHWGMSRVVLKFGQQASLVD